MTLSPHYINTIYPIYKVKCPFAKYPPPPPHAAHDSLSSLDLSTHPNYILRDSLIQVLFKFIPRNHVECTEWRRRFEWLTAQKDSDKVCRRRRRRRRGILFPEFKDDFGTHPWPHWLSPSQSPVILLKICGREGEEDILGRSGVYREQERQTHHGQNYPAYRFSPIYIYIKGRDSLVEILDIVGTINLAIHMTLKLTEPRAHC